MTNEILKNKVIAYLIKCGNNVNETKEMVELHFELAFTKFKTVKQISNFIRIVY
jgi:hypothetical protein